MQGLHSLVVPAVPTTAPRGEGGETHLENHRMDDLDHYLRVAVRGLNLSDDMNPSGHVRANIGTISLAPDHDDSWFGPSAYKAMVSKALVRRAKLAAATKAWQVLARNFHNDFVDAPLLVESMAKLDEVNEKGEVHPAAVDNAKSLLPDLYRIYPALYSTERSERNGVTLSPPMKNGAAVSIEVDGSGVVYCFASIHGNLRRAKFFQMDGLPDGFIAKALWDLAEAE